MDPLFNTPVGPIGTTLAALNDWATGRPRSNLAKMFRALSSNRATPYDGSLGSVIRYPDKTFSAFAQLTDYPKGDYDYSLIADAGEVVFENGCSNQRRQGPRSGTVTIDGNNGSFSCTVLNPVNISDFTIVVAGTKPTSSFTSEYLSDLRRFNGPLRMLDWGLINNSIQVNWQDRALLGGITILNGNIVVPLETMIEVCNVLGLPLWLNIPHRATNSWWVGALSVIKRLLNPALAVYLELGNENWNGQFTQHHQLMEEVGGPPNYERLYPLVIDRLIGITTYFNRGLGADRVFGVLAGQASNTWWTQTGLDYLLTKGRNVFDATVRVLAYADYFETSLDAEINNPTLDGLFKSLNAFIDGQGLKNVKEFRAQADHYGIKQLYTYEGGCYMPDRINNAILNRDLHLQAYMDQRMYACYQKTIRQFFANGGNCWMNYSSCGSIGNGDEGRFVVTRFTGDRTPQATAIFELTGHPFDVNPTPPSPPPPPVIVPPQLTEVDLVNPNGISLTVPANAGFSLTKKYSDGTTNVTLF